MQKGARYKLGQFSAKSGELKYWGKWQSKVFGTFFHFSAQRTEAVWFVVEVPQDAPGGVYEGMVNMIGVLHSMERSPSAKSMRDWRLGINSGLLLMVNRL